MPAKYRSSFSKFRFGVAPIRLETGRYEHLPVDQRLCEFCNDNAVEDELHVILKCTFYDDLREELFEAAENINNNFMNLSDTDKFSFLFSNCNIVKLCAKSCYNILSRRSSYLYR